MLFLVGIVLGACTAHTQPTAPAVHVIDAAELESKTVALMQPGDDGTPGFCAGVWVSRTTILTAHHCADATAPVAYFLTHEDLYPHGAFAVARDVSPHAATRYADDTAHDLALLRASAPPAGHGIAYVRIAPVVQGMRVHTMGHPFNFWFTYSSGDLTAIREKDVNDGNGKMLWVQSSAPISPGNSGGGLFDNDGALVGLTDGIVDGGPALSLFVHPSYVDALLRAQGSGL